jgi:hypothetical protein
VDLIFRLFLSSAVWYLKRLKQINTLIEKAKHNLDQGVNNESLIGLSRLQDSLTYFITSIRGNENLLQKLKFKLQVDELDADLIEDVSIEMTQARETTNIYSDILESTMETYSSIINNNMNTVMRTLTSVSIIMMFPTLIASIFGMNLINGMEIEGNENFRATANEVISKHFVEGNLTRAKNIGYIRKERSEKTNVVGFEALYGETGDPGEEYSLVHKDLKWTFTDNPVVIKAGSLAQRMREERLKRLSGMEGIDSAIGNVFKKKKGAHKANNNHVKIPEKKALEQELDNLYPNRRYNHIESLSVRKGQSWQSQARYGGCQLAQSP